MAGTVSTHALRGRNKPTEGPGSTIPVDQAANTSTSDALSLPRYIDFDVDGSDLAMEVVPLGAYTESLGAVPRLIDAFERRARMMAFVEGGLDKPISLARVDATQGGNILFIEPLYKPEHSRNLIWLDMIAVAEGLRLHYHEVRFWPSRIYLFNQGDPKRAETVIGSGNLVTDDLSTSNHSTGIVLPADLMANATPPVVADMTTS